ncbi:hypothetical protein [Tortoise microvirus 80]|nr:hypothetical protein [Tortoise microvirus 80]
MADIKLIYPIPKDFIEHSERVDPELFYYMCFHGKQVFLRRFRGSSYQVVTGNWKPQGVQSESSNFEQMMAYHVIYTSKLLENCVMMWKKCVVELISCQFDLFDFSTLEISDADDVLR